MDKYRPAAVCRRGHEATSDMARMGRPAPRCSECGAKVLTACEGCGGRIRGSYYVDSDWSLGDAYAPPDFCDLCGAPHPWAGREARLYELENILDEQKLDEATRLQVREQLQALRESSISDEEQKQRWEKVQRMAPGLWQAGERILETVVSAAIKAQLGL